MGVVLCFFLFDAQGQQKLGGFGGEKGTPKTVTTSLKQTSNKNASQKIGPKNPQKDISWTPTIDCPGGQTYCYFFREVYTHSPKFSRLVEVNDAN